MKEVVINGVEYLSAASLAKEFRYTTDYIGQLCRAKKVDAQLVGRSWYVNPLSLKAHKQARYVKVLTNDPLVAEKVEVNFTKIEVLPNNTTIIPNHSEKNFAKRIDWKPLKYEDDKGDLLPSINKQPDATIPIKLADSIDIPIKIKEEPIKMVAEDLPTVSLSGVLNVTSIEDDFHAEASYSKSSSVLDDIPLPPVPAVLKSKPLVRPVAIPKKNVTISHENESFQKDVTDSTSLIQPIPTISIEKEIESTNLLEVILIITSLVLIIVLFVLLFSESNILATKNSSVRSINFTMDSLKILSSFTFLNN